KEHAMKSPLDQILRAAERAADLTKRLLIFSRKQANFPKPVKVNEIIAAAENLLSRLIGEDIELKLVLPAKDLIVMADVAQMEQLLMNLATNARDAMPDGGVLTIRTEAVNIDAEFIRNYGYGKQGAYALLTFSDTGTGIDKETMGKIFDPFFTTKEVNKGTGLGLSIVYGIIKQHNGFIDVYSEPGEGASFMIYLPLTGEMIDDKMTSGKPRIIGGSETVLLAEDDRWVRNIAKVCLEQYGYRVIEAVDGEDAVKRFRENKDNIHLVLLDVIMPKKNDREAYEDIKRIRSDAKVIFASGYPADVIHRKGIITEGAEFISKPYTPSELLETIRKALRK
ncbi:MAG TPA: ATP-binding protein, partial [Dissulfurispiraceae bacterium]|nr:ATP-binding protein [Dissulfurispiraceae bacterium]